MKAHYLPILTGLFNITHVFLGILIHVISGRSASNLPFISEIFLERHSIESKLVTFCLIIGSVLTLLTSFAIYFRNLNIRHATGKYRVLSFLLLNLASSMYLVRSFFNRCEQIDTHAALSIISSLSAVGWTFLSSHCCRSTQPKIELVRFFMSTISMIAIMVGYYNVLRSVFITPDAFQTCNLANARDILKNASVSEYIVWFCLNMFLVSYSANLASEGIVHHKRKSR
ncbi:hypothetical protein P9112_013988 [Eukaryota sp. TZLM1-RC]